MKEIDYINATNIATLRAIRTLLSDVFIESTSKRIELEKAILSVNTLIFIYDKEIGDLEDLT